MQTNNGIVSNQPFGKFIDELFNKSISDIVGTDFTNESPAVNVIEKDDSFELAVAAPGLEKEDFSVTIDKDQLIISAEKADVSEDKLKDQSFKRKEYNFQKFTRKFRLPNTVDKESISAKYELGILKLTVQKTAEAKEKEPKKIIID